MTSDPIVRICLMTPPGPVAISWGGGHLRSILLNESCTPTGAPDAGFQKFLDQLNDYLAGRRVRFRAPFDLSGLPPFRREVLQACAQIPWGATRTYGELARLVGSPNAARAVGQAMAHNPLPIVIPCHRVLSAGGAGGFMGSFQGGLDWKRWLLHLEGVAV